MKTAIVIPARFASKRLPGKPLALIRGRTMLERVVSIARAAASSTHGVEIIVATDDTRIAQHGRTLGATVVMTDPAAPSGTDRVAEAVQQLEYQPDFILNLQGDAPLTPPDFLRALILSFQQLPCEMITPVTQLTWEELDKFRENKKSTPLSGTTAIFDVSTGQAFWFSKTILPSIRDEEKLRQESKMSPVYRHIGLYGYSYAMLQRYISLPESSYEKLEGLEQLRVLENNHHIRCVAVDYKGRANMSGIDSPEDIARAEALIDKHGELPV